MNFLITLAILIVAAILTSLLVKTPNQKPASLEEFEFPQADEGTPQAVIFGDVWTPGWQVLWYGNLRTKKIKSKGKK